jgi:MFS family permease
LITPYRRLLTHRGVPQLIIIGVLAKLGTPVLSLALLLAVVDGLGSYAGAGLVLTAHAMSLALCAPVGGRLADRLGARRTLAGYLAVHAIAYSLLLLALGARASLPMILPTAALLGATSPPAGAVIRGVWSRLVPTESLPAGYALDSAINELMFISGPVLVSALMLLMAAQTVVIVAGASVLLGSAWLMASSAAGHRPERSENATRRRAAGPLTHRPTLVLLVLAGFGTFSFGSLRIATVASATAFGSQSCSGLLMGLLSAGALAGGLIYGSRTLEMTGRRQLILLSTADAACMFAGVVAPGLLALGIVITLTGLLTGPRDTLQPALLAEQVPAAYRTEVFAWLNTFMWAGYGVGTTAAGALTGPDDNGTAAFTTAAAVALGAAVLAAVLYRPTSPPADRMAQPDQAATDRT